MRTVVTPAEMAALDAYTTKSIGIPGAVLMERAALAVAEYIKQVYPGLSVLVVCGPGNNGGDGLAIARILHGWGIAVRCFAPVADYKGDALANYKAAVNSAVGFVHSIEEFKVTASGAGIIVDALFGTGLSHDLSDQWLEIVNRINESGRPVVSVDIPSGIDGETGRIRGVAVKADCTVTFQLAKTGHYLYPGREYTGQLVISDIGIADNRELYKPRHVLEPVDAAYPKRNPNSYKGTYGHVVVIAGSLGMLGAGALASRAAMRGGAGLVTWVVPESLTIAASSLVTEVMILPVPDEGGRLSACSEKNVLEALKGKSAAVIGPGLSRNSGTVELIRNILHTIDIPMVLDADGLFAVSGYPELLPRVEKVLMPHTGEMARLLGCTIAEVEDDPMGIVQRCAGFYGGSAVLKGSTTLIAAGSEIAFNLTGNPGMAPGGLETYWLG